MSKTLDMAIIILWGKKKQIYQYNRKELGIITHTRLYQQ